MARRPSPTPAPKPKPIAVIPSGLPIAEIIARLAEVQAQYPDARVRRGAANKWEIWPPDPKDVQNMQSAPQHRKPAQPTPTR